MSRFLTLVLLFSAVRCQPSPGASDWDGPIFAPLPPWPQQVEQDGFDARPAKILSGSLDSSEVKRAYLNKHMPQVEVLFAILSHCIGSLSLTCICTFATIATQKYGSPTTLHPNKIIASPQPSPQPSPPPGRSSMPPGQSSTPLGQILQGANANLYGSPSGIPNSSPSAGSPSDTSVGDYPPFSFRSSNPCQSRDPDDSKQILIQALQGKSRSAHKPNPALNESRKRQSPEQRSSADPYAFPAEDSPPRLPVQGGSSPLKRLSNTSKGANVDGKAPLQPFVSGPVWKASWNNNSNLAAPPPRKRNAHGSPTRTSPSSRLSNSAFKPMRNTSHKPKPPNALTGVRPQKAVSEQSPHQKLKARLTAVGVFHDCTEASEWPIRGTILPEHCSKDKGVITCTKENKEVVLRAEGQLMYFVTLKTIRSDNKSEELYYAVDYAVYGVLEALSLGCLQACYALETGEFYQPQKKKESDMGLYIEAYSQFARDAHAQLKLPRGHSSSASGSSNSSSASSLVA